jgi:ATP-dependent RNA helicase DDX55/SPB4
LSNFYAITDEDTKLSTFVHFLQENKDKKLIVFFLTCACVNYFWKVPSALDSLLTLIGTEGIASIKGHQPDFYTREDPYKKENEYFQKPFASLTGSGVVEKFDAMTSGVLLTTDVAARGLDFTKNPINWVVQYDAPQDPAFFIHRVGRAARMGASGNALSFFYPSEITYLGTYLHEEGSEGEIED